MVFSVSLQFPECTLWRQWVAGAAAMIMMFVIGLSIGWSSPYVAKFTSGDAPFPVTMSEISWMVLVRYLGSFLGVILGAVYVEYFGSKAAMIGNGCILIVSWILVILADSVSYLYVSRFISGASIEVAYVSFPFYLGDIASLRIRGALIILAMSGIVIGVLVGNVMGTYLSMKLFACVTLVSITCFLLAFSWMPHSPYYLTRKGRIKEAERSILRFNPKANVQLEMESIQKFLAISNSTTVIDRLRELNIPRNRKAGIIMIALCLFDHLTGVNPLTSYMENIMTRGMITVIAPSTVPIIANTIGIIAGWVSMYFTEKCGRRIMWVVSSAGICIAMTALGTHFYLIGNGFDHAGLQWLPLSSTILFYIFYTMGLSCIPFILLSELFATNIQTLARCVVSIAMSIFGFLSIYGYQFLIELIDEAFVWWIHGIFMAVSLVVGLLLVPETKGKTLLEIQDLLMNN